MPEIVRTGRGTWRGDLKTGIGTASTPSGALKDARVTFSSRFESAPGANPEELIAAAHASCFSMFLANILASDGHAATEIHTVATLRMRLGEGGPTIISVHLAVDGRVHGIDAGAFQAAALKAKDGCPVSKLLKPGLESLTMESKLAG